jgi:hypothetical protein
MGITPDWIMSGCDAAAIVADTACSETKLDTKSKSVTNSEESPLDRETPRRAVFTEST